MRPFFARAGGDTMKQAFLIALALGLALMAAACSTQTGTQYPAPPAPAVTPPVPTQPTATPSGPTETALPAEPAAPQAQTVKDAAAILNGNTSSGSDGTITDIRCNAEEKTLTFTLNNIGTKTWQLYGLVPFPAPQGLVQAKVFINNYQANSAQPNYDPSTGQPYFGPNAKFSDDCGGVDKLAPGESATCSLTNVPLKAQSEFANKNTIWVGSDTGASNTVTFLCG